MNRLTMVLCLWVLAAGTAGWASSGEQGTSDDETPPSVTSDSTVSAERLPDSATDEPPVLHQESTLEDYLVYAALNNPDLEAAFHQWQAALKKIAQARSLPDPELSYGYFIREVETRVGPQQQRLGLSQMFPWFGKLGLRGQVASQEAMAAEQQYEAAKLRLFYQVKEAYHEYSYLGRAIAIARENVELLTYLESVARTKYKAGAGAHAGVIRAQVELGKLENRLRSLEDLKRPLVARLNASLNRSSDAALPLPESISEKRVSFSDEELIAWLKEDNPELKALAFVAAKEEKAVRLAKKESYPDFMLGVEYIDTDRAIMPTRDSGKDPVVAKLSINLPIWQAKYRALAEERRRRQEAAVARRTNRENQLMADLQMALYRFRDAERKIDLYRDTLIPKAEESLSVTQQGFAADRADFLDLIDAQRVLLDFQLSHERALADRAQSLAEIESVVGRDISVSR